MEYTIKQAMPIIAIKDTDPWELKNFRQSATKFTNTFTEDECLIHPNVIECRHDAPNAFVVGAAYAAMGYFGFQRDGFIILTPLENVIVHTDSGVKRETIIDLTQEENQCPM